MTATQFASHQAPEFPVVSDDSETFELWGIWLPSGDYPEGGTWLRTGLGQEGRRVFFEDRKSAEAEFDEADCEDVGGEIVRLTVTRA